MIIQLSSLPSRRLFLRCKAASSSNRFPLILQNETDLLLFDEYMNQLGMIECPSSAQLLPNGFIRMNDILFKITYEQVDPRPKTITGSTDVLEVDYYPPEPKLILRQVIDKSDWKVQKSENEKSGLFFKERFVCHFSNGQVAYFEFFGLFFIVDGPNLCELNCFNGDARLWSIKTPSKVISLVEGPVFGCEGHVIINCKDHIGVVSPNGERSFVKAVHDPNVCFWSNYYWGLLVAVDSEAQVLALNIKLKRDLRLANYESLHIGERIVDLNADYSKLGALRDIRPDPNGKVLVVWGPFGFCLCDIDHRLWKLFGSLEQESSFSTLDILWLQNNPEFIIICKEKSSITMRKFNVWEEVDLRKSLFSFKMKKYVDRLFYVDKDKFFSYNASTGELYLHSTLDGSVLLETNLGPSITQIYTETINDTQVLLLLRGGLLFELPLNALLVAGNPPQQAFEARLFLKLEGGSYIMRFWRVKDPAIEPITWTILKVCKSDGTFIKLIELDRELAIDVSTSEIRANESILGVDEIEFCIEKSGSNGSTSCWLAPYILYSLIEGNFSGETSILLRYWSSDSRLPQALEHILARLLLNHKTPSVLKLFHKQVSEFVGWSVYRKCIARVARALELDEAQVLFESTISLGEIFESALKDRDVDILLIVFRLELALSGTEQTEHIRKFIDILLEDMHVDEFISVVSFLKNFQYDLANLSSIVGYWMNEYLRRRLYVPFFRMHQILPELDVELPP